MATKSKITLGGIPMWVNPEEVQWDISLKVSDTKALTGKVIQITGVKMSDLRVRGHFSPDRAKGDRGDEVWKAQNRWREEIKGMAREAEGAPGDRATPVVFAYPDRGWEFNVFVKALSNVVFDNTTTAPAWDLTLFPVGAESRSVVRGIKDIYIARLMDGVGWKQTAYNGPSDEEVVAELGGRDPDQYMQDYYSDAFTEGAPQ